MASPGSAAEPRARALRFFKFSRSAAASRSARSSVSAIMLG
jgi:hypothetical protein